MLAGVVAQAARPRRSRQPLARTRWLCGLLRAKVRPVAVQSLRNGCGMTKRAKVGDGRMQARFEQKKARLNAGN